MCCVFFEGDIGIRRFCLTPGVRCVYKGQGPGRAQTSAGPSQGRAQTNAGPGPGRAQTNAGPGPVPDPTNANQCNQCKPRQANATKSNQCKFSVGYSGWCRLVAPHRRYHASQHSTRPTTHLLLITKIQIKSIPVGHVFWSKSDPDESSGRADTGKLLRIAVRTLWA